MTRRRTVRSRAGFTLAEMIVASTLMAIIMSAVYVSFHSALRVWRSGDRSAVAYQDARVALSIMSRELHSVVSGTAHLVVGSDQELEFYTAVPPMDPDEAESTRVLWVRYRMVRTSGERGRTLQRTEAVVEGPVPFWEPGMDVPTAAPLRLGQRRSFDMATGIRELKFTYIWVVPMPEAELEPGVVLVPPEPLEVDQNQEGWGLPQGLRIRLTMEEEETEAGEVAFQTMVVFRGETTPLGEGPMGGPSGGAF